MSETTKELERLVRETSPQPWSVESQETANAIKDAEHESVAYTAQSKGGYGNDKQDADARMLALAPALAAEVLAGRKALTQAREAVQEVEIHCPCGARPESLDTHPHVGGCPVAKALAALEVPDGE